jgi:heme/copper-type cytochrome/quinol oxidase subunit 4
VFAKASKLLHQIIDIKSFEIAAVVVTVLSYIAVALLIFIHLSQKWEADGKRMNPWLVGLITVAAMLVGPIFLFTFPDRMYLGYITGNPYHNPTQLLLRPFALLLFYHAYNNLYARRNLGNILIAAVLIVAATQSKSNFTLTFLPALAILALIQIRKLKDLNWLYVIFGLGIPAFATLAAQYFISFTGDRVDSIIFAPFKAILMFVPNVWILLLFTLLSILFPLIVTFFYWKQARINLRLRLAWINFGVAFVIAILFSQVINMASLNFWWGPSIGLFILFVECIELAGNNGMFSFREPSHKVQQIVGRAVFSLHLLCGIMFYLNSVLFPSPYL